MINAIVLKLRNYTLRTRLLGSLVVTLVLMTAVAFVGFIGLQRAQAQAQHLTQNVVGQLTALGDVRGGLGELRRYEKDMVINYEDTAKVSEYRKKWDGELARILSQLDAMALAAADNSELQQSLATVKTSVADYAKASEPVFRQIEASGYDTATVANRMLGRAKDVIHAGETQIEALRLSIHQSAEAARSDSANAKQQAMALLAGACALAFLVLVPFTLANAASICAPLVQAQQLAHSIAQGNLSNRSEAQGKDEVAALQQSLHDMQQALRSVVGDVRTGVDAIGTASAQIASGNQDLSSRTEQTSSSLQQASSSLQELTGTVSQTADSARTANQLAASASQAAQRGGEVVGQVVSTMQDINSSSRRIADIIGTIDGIAFQTNILALNAAVEAARAGEQGRGFAVVASEVRSLAQRSADAARQIKGLIQASVEKVETGTRLVQDAGSAMGDIVSGVQRVTDVIGEISAATAEQTVGLRQVNDAVSGLDQMTQQNAALVEQSAAAAESLAEQSRKLGTVVGSFVLAESGNAAPKSAAAPSKAAAFQPAPKPAPHAKAVTQQVLAAARKAKPVEQAKAQPKQPAAQAAEPSQRKASTANTAAADGEWESF